jgi:selenocysteine-specific translation elongation factor
MPDICAGIFGSDRDTIVSFAGAVAKKSEVSGISVYQRAEPGRKASLLVPDDFPERVQGSAKIASFADGAIYIFPKTGKLAPSDGELAVLLTCFRPQGTLVIPEGASDPEAAKAWLKGTIVSDYSVDQRRLDSGVLDLSSVGARSDLARDGTLVYVDRVFSVKGVGTVALGFVLSGTVRVHDQLRPIPSEREMRVDIKGIQVNDVDFDSAGRGVRVGLSLRGAEPKDLERCRWLDDGSFSTADKIGFEFAQSPFYKQGVAQRDLHVQLPGEMVPARIEGEDGAGLSASLPFRVPAWDGMRLAVIDLNGKGLRVAGAGTCKL